jgi:uncharacterized protein (TIGR02594 family)
LKWYDIARAEQAKGIEEYAGTAKNNPAILQYYRDVGVPQKHDEVAWCAAFAGSCLERAGIRSTRSLMARSYTDFGVPLAKPREGCVVVFWRTSKTSGYGHVGFFVRETANYIYVLGGNQSNQISVAPYPKSRLLGYRWPKEIPADAPAPAGFKRAVKIVLDMEGGYTDHPDDPGGPTNKGVTLAEYATFLGKRLNDETRPGLVLRLKVIPDVDVEAIYRRNYWGPASCDDLPEPLAIYLFDTAVLHGVPKAIKYLQEALGVKVDGVIGPKTIAAAKGSNLAAVLPRYRDIRLRQLQKSKNWDTFGKGWAARVNAVLEDVLPDVPKVAVTKPAPQVAKAPALAPQAAPALQTKEAKVAVDTTGDAPATKHWSSSLTIWGTIVTFLATVLPIVGPLLGFPITADMVNTFGEGVAQVIQAVGGLVGTALAIYGRFRAAEPLGTAKLQVRV